MSNSLAIATVTSALQRQLQLAATQAVSGATVKVGCPNTTNATKDPEVYICLYQITPNLAYYNENLPYRNSKDELINQTQSALNLHYLISFLGDNLKLEPQRLLGSVVSILEAKPTITTSLIQDTIKQPSATFLKDSNLASQEEQVKFTAEAFSLEELAKLWSSFFHQMPYTLSVAYEASVVLINGNEIVKSTSTVSTRKLSTVVADTPPIFKAGGITLSGLSRTLNKINASVQITKATDESNLNYYVLYWSQDGLTKLPKTLPIAEIFKTGKNLVCPLPKDTIVPTNAKYILVLTKNTAGEMRDGVSVFFASATLHVPNNKASGISNTLKIVDNKITSGSVTVVKAANENDITDYVLYWSQDGNRKLSGASAITTLPKTGSLVYTLASGTTLPTNAKYIIVFTKNANGEMQTGLSTILTTTTIDKKTYTDKSDEKYLDRSGNPYQGR